LCFIIIGIIIGIKYVITLRRSKSMAIQTVRTTLALPADLLAAVDQAVQAGKARSRNELVRVALERELAAQQRDAIDAAFAEMAQDPHYQAEAKAITREFAISDWEAWQQTEGSG
jgi:Arc/MetJ-type ribon-helix-helix transcriptional regulator